VRKRHLYIAAGLGAATLAVLGASGGVSFAGAPAAPAADSFLGGPITVPATLVPPAGNKLTAVFKAGGVQIYGCTNGAWTLIEPAASLTGITTVAPVQRVTALHFRGPSWESDQDGSLVEGTTPVSAPSDTPNSIPQLLVTAKTSARPGVFGGVTFVQRLATVGGVAPAGTCAAGATTASAYRAVYRFFKAG
jgi:Protein of unknown function (DUF3455)